MWLFVNVTHIYLIMYVNNTPTGTLHYDNYLSPETRIQMTRCLNVVNMEGIGFG